MAVSRKASSNVPTFLLKTRLSLTSSVLSSSVANFKANTVGPV